MGGVDRVDRILEVIDGGLQSSPENGYGSDRPASCARCLSRPKTDGEFCAGCRAYLLGDADEPPPYAEDTEWTLQQGSSVVVFRYADDGGWWSGPEFDRAYLNRWNLYSAVAVEAEVLWLPDGVWASAQVDRPHSGAGPLADGAHTAT